MLPLLDRSPNVAPASRRKPFRCWFWILLVDMIVLTIMGKLPPVGIYTTIGTVAAWVFILLWVALPIVTKLEKPVRRSK
jgi:ubiquinol-cytochrome c reductase cytochrome b subunit